MRRRSKMSSADKPSIIGAELNHEMPGAATGPAAERDPGAGVERRESGDDGGEEREHRWFQDLELEGRRDREHLRGNRDPTQSARPHASFAVLCSGSAVIGGSKKDRRVSSIWLPWMKIAGLGRVSARGVAPDCCAPANRMAGSLLKTCRRSADELGSPREFQGASGGFKPMSVVAKYAVVAGLAVLVTAASPARAGDYLSGFGLRDFGAG